MYKTDSFDLSITPNRFCIMSSICNTQLCRIPYYFIKNTHYLLPFVQPTWYIVKEFKLHRGELTTCLIISIADLLQKFHCCQNSQIVHHLYSESGCSSLLWFPCVDIDRLDSRCPQDIRK